ncbi:hypothetical protein EDD86DRAFT_113098 [Gorgonomyces haynaldii]|nr:hypothetical protein EDD86DRAFT_113098 [Gorgonomyces haynaldii]
MSLETGEQLIVLGEKQDSKTPGERWSSIDEMETATDSQELQFVVEPNDLPKHVESFLEFSAKYGSSWVLALKLRVYGSKTQIKVMLRDLGLVPANYVEKASIQ